MFSRHTPYRLPGDHPGRGRNAGRAVRPRASRPPSETAALINGWANSRMRVANNADWDGWWTPYTVLKAFREVLDEPISRPPGRRGCLMRPGAWRGTPTTWSPRTFSKALTSYRPSSRSDYALSRRPMCAQPRCASRSVMAGLAACWTTTELPWRRH